jgi:Domain of unknown function (DUF6919)
MDDREPNDRDGEMDPEDAARWRAARTLADLGELTAQWLEGKIASSNWSGPFGLYVTVARHGLIEPRPARPARARPRILRWLSRSERVGAHEARVAR